jgi:microcompartment protein CcmK/EutM
MLLDLNGVPGVGSYSSGPGNVADARKAAVLFDGTNCYDNHIQKAEVGRAPFMVAFTNSSFRNEIELAYFGNSVNIDDAGAGIENVVYIAQGQQPSATANTKITSSNSNVKIVDRRKGSNNTGSSTQSGNASATSFNIAHGCFTTPLTWYVQPTSADARGSILVTATSTNLVVSYSTAPPSGTSNLTWVWSAAVY